MAIIDTKTSSTNFIKNLADLKKTLQFKTDVQLYQYLKISKNQFVTWTYRHNLPTLSTLCKMSNQAQIDIDSWFEDELKPSQIHYDDSWAPDALQFYMHQNQIKIRDMVHLSHTKQVANICNTKHPYTRNITMKPVFAIIEVLDLKISDITTNHYQDQRAQNITQLIKNLNQKRSL